MTIIISVILISVMVDVCYRVNWYIRDYYIDFYLSIPYYWLGYITDSLNVIISVLMGSFVKYRLTYEKNKMLNNILYYGSAIFNILIVLVTCSFVYICLALGYAVSEF